MGVLRAGTVGGCGMGGGTGAWHEEHLLRSGVMPA